MKIDKILIFLASNFQQLLEAEIIVYLDLWHPFSPIESRWADGLRFFMRKLEQVLDLQIS